MSILDRDAVPAVVDVAGSDPMPDLGRLPTPYVGYGGNARTLFSTILVPK